MRNYKIISIGLLIVGVVLSAITLDYSKFLGIVGFSALILSALSSLVSINSPTKFERKFSYDDWKENDSGSYFILVTDSAHAMGKSSAVTVYQNEGGIYSEVVASIRTTEMGNVMIGANSKFEGKVVIS